MDATADDLGDGPDDLVTALLAAFDRYVGRHGFEAALALLAARRNPVETDARNDGGRPAVDDDTRLDRLAWHLANDPDLQALGRQGKPILSEAARRAVLDMPAPGDVAHNGTVNKGAWRRLVRKFPWFCFDVPGRGFDQGEWRPPNTT